MRAACIADRAGLQTVSLGRPFRRRLVARPRLLGALLRAVSALDVGASVFPRATCGRSPRERGDARSQLATAHRETSASPHSVGNCPTFPADPLSDPRGVQDSRGVGGAERADSVSILTQWWGRKKMEQSGCWNTKVVYQVGKLPYDIVMDGTTEEGNMGEAKAREFERKFGAFTRVEGGRVVRCDGVHVVDVTEFPEEVRAKANLTGCAHALLTAVGRKLPLVRFYALVGAGGGRAAFAVVGEERVQWRDDCEHEWRSLKARAGVARSRDDV